MAIKPKTREEKKKEAEADLDYLRQVDLPESRGGGRKFVHDIRQDEKAKSQKKEDNEKTHLEGKGISTYLLALAEFGQERLNNLELGAGWQANCIPTNGGRIGIYGRGFETKEGIIVVVRAPSGKVFIRGVRVTTSPEIDMGALKTLVEQAENTADGEKGLLITGDRPKGIYLP